MIKDITKQFDIDIAKKIFANKKTAIEYLVEFDKIHSISELYNSRGTVIRDSSKIWELVVRSWDYNVSRGIIRTLFQRSEKYKRGLEANNAVTVLRQEWQKLKLGNFEWPFSQGDFDNFVQRINALNDNTSIEKDDKVKEAAVKFRRIKEINTYRNDFIETLIYTTSDAILPTMAHRRGVDFYINGISFDQKVSKSVTNEFKNNYGTDWRIQAIENPLKVAEYLYKYQDEGRFGSDPRLLVVYIDEDISANRIEEIINNTDFKSPQKVSFTFFHRSGGLKTYSTECVVILLYNK